MFFLTDFKIGFWNAWIFMSAFLIQMLVIFFVDKRVRERSHISFKLRRNRLERYASILGNIIWFLALAYSVFLPLRTGTIWFYTGLVVFMTGLSLLTFATYNFIATPVDQLITKGVYSISRHPMYLATFLICAGAGFASGSLLFVSLSIIMSFCFYQEAVIEERYCLDRYGSAYREYQKKTSRFIGIPQKHPG
ncbi:MAG: hypothetical protein AMS27_16480 [Bacteroides sp. SM23_62_1]|nr:MAG: hypothetical protein AMS27_16480 [Bacteroides sp. SM23_62_1]